MPDTFDLFPAVFQKTPDEPCSLVPGIGVILPDDDNLTLVNSYFFVNETKKEERKKPEIAEKGNEENTEDNSK